MTVTTPEVPPPERPVPAVTPVIVPPPPPPPDGALTQVGLPETRERNCPFVPPVGTGLSIFTVTAPETPPPERPVPAVTPVIVPIVPGRLSKIVLYAEVNGLATFKIFPEVPSPVRVESVAMADNPPPPELPIRVLTA